MGALGSDAAIEAADIVLMDDDPLKISKAIRISRKCLRIVYENIYFAIGVKVICLILGALGIANMWAAIFADVGVMIIAVLNAIRALNVKKAVKKMERTMQEKEELEMDHCEETEVHEELLRIVQEKLPEAILATYDTEGGRERSGKLCAKDREGDGMGRCDRSGPRDRDGGLCQMHGGKCPEGRLCPDHS